jgi:DNA-binding XRE family transcriptional regulator
MSRSANDESGVPLNVGTESLAYLRAWRHILATGGSRRECVSGTTGWRSGSAGPRSFAQGARRRARKVVCMICGLILGRIYEFVLMRSSVYDVLPPRVRRSLTKFGADLALARRKRQLTAAMMSERLGVAKSTYVRVEKGDPTVSMGVYAMALFVLGFGDAFGDLVAASRDEQGLLLDEQRVPKRVHPKTEPTSL